MENAKPWWTSKTIWTNLIALAGSLVVAIGFDPGRWAEISTVSLAVVNVALRLITNEPVSLTTDQS
jgi:hypothetical protein